MKSKVKSSSKDINIDINIENNLMSKNKIKTVDDKNDKVNTKPQISSTEYTYNPELPRLINEYYGIMASKQPYAISGRSQPLNLNHYLPTYPQGQPVTNQSQQAQPAQHSMGQPAQHSTTATNIPGGNEDEIYEDSVDFLPTDVPVGDPFQANIPAINETPNETPTDAPPPQADAPEDNAPQAQSLGYNLNLDFLGQLDNITVNDTAIPVFNMEQEDSYSDKLKSTNNSKYNTRNNIVRKLKDVSNNPTYKPQIDSVIEKKLAGILKEYRPDLYSKFLNGTY